MKWDFFVSNLQYFTSFWTRKWKDYEPYDSHEECRLLAYKSSVRTSQETHYFSTTESSRLMLCKIWGFHGSDYEECRLLGYENSVRTSQETHYVSTTESSRLMLCKIWCFHSDDYEECRPLGCDVVWLLSKHTSRRNVCGPSLRWKESVRVGTMLAELSNSLFTRATLSHIPEDDILHSYRRGNLRSYLCQPIFGPGCETRFSVLRTCFIPPQLWRCVLWMNVSCRHVSMLCSK
jgi:hypothetical protein